MCCDCKIFSWGKIIVLHMWIKINIYINEPFLQIVDAGALPIFLDMLKGDHVEEQAITARALWTLSFDKDVCQQIIEFPEMMERLETLRSSVDKEVAKNVNGALFVLKGENDVSKRKFYSSYGRGCVKSQFSLSPNVSSTVLSVGLCKRSIFISQYF